MGILDKKVSNANHAKDLNNPSDRSPVYGKKFNDLIDELSDGTSTDFKVDTLSADTISETTSGNGVAVDGVTLKDGGVTATGTKIFNGTTTSSGAGAVAITGYIHEVTTTGTGDALTLADGAEGQELVIAYVAEGAGADTAVLTPTNLAGGTTITFNNVGDTADLIFTAGSWFKKGGAAVIA